ncbi:MAG: hypothetical protein ACLQDV_16935 [Candidatus Binataceae bacterium]
MGQEHRIELRTPDKLWATLNISDAGMVLRHDLDDVGIATCPGLLAYENGCQLQLAQGLQLILSESSGQVRLKANTDDDGILSDVVDPQGKAFLVVELRGSGSIDDQPVQPGSLVLNLKPMGS